MILAYGQLALAMILVGANVGVAKLLADALPIAMIACLRCALAVVVLWPLARMIEGRVSVPAAVKRNLFLQAVFGTALYNAGLLAGLRFTSALEGGLVLATLPAVVALGSFLWLRERLSARQWLAAGLAGFGMAAITLARLGGGGGGSALGNLLVFLGVCGEAIYVLLARRVAGAVPVITASLWMQAFSALFLLPFAAPGYAAIAALADPYLLGLLLFHSITASVLCLLLWYAGMKRVPAATAGVFTAFLPASAAVTAVLFLGEDFGLIHLAGFVLMMTSLLLATWPGRGKAASMPGHAPMARPDRP
ncbi:DMT family transporter [Sediminicoccus rosea]|jgi:drug/metabolite transporter (DMT)-like permease|uniref:DMT family transporter n=1 Tax=Sediminicoccus rosea TaxID=1225128 RepID=A0ABZ0PL80_9PROT|nr:DMT family transporter [Sediminicoccus rosea]WPB86227.1 DMT family transporter [Sediminicoccus rosea]